MDEPKNVSKLIIEAVFRNWSELAIKNIHPTPEEVNDLFAAARKCGLTEVFCELATKLAGECTQRAIEEHKKIKEKYG